MSLFDNRYPEASNIVVGTLSEAKRDYKMFHAVISIEDIVGSQGLRTKDTEQLVLAFDDIESPAGDIRAVSEHHVKNALEFARTHQNRMVLVHCHAGQCRSPAIALAIIADRMGQGREIEAVVALKVVRRWATPNKLVVQIADKVLHRNGALVSALEKYGNKITRLGSVGLLKSASENKNYYSWNDRRVINSE
jgi:predicted protein tyrosine phosphatase